MCKSVSSSSVHGTDMSLHRRLDEQTVLVTGVIVVVNHGLQIIRIFLHKLENLIFLGTKPLNLLHPFIFLCSIGISLPDEFFLTHVSIGILLIFDKFILLTLPFFYFRYKLYINLQKIPSELLEFSLSTRHLFLLIHINQLCPHHLSDIEKWDCNCCTAGND